MVLTGTYTTLLFDIVAIAKAENLGCKIKVIDLHISEKRTQTAASRILASHDIDQIFVRLVNKRVID